MGQTAGRVGDRLPVGGDKPADVPEGLLPDGAVVVLASGPIDADGRVPGTAAVWYAWDRFL